MFKNNQALDAYLNSKQTLETDLLRFLLSDQVSLSLNDVLINKGNPVDYANQMLDKHRYDLYYLFFENAVKDYKLPNYLTDGWIFDTIVTAATTLRILTLRPSKLEELDELATQTSLFQLCLDDNVIPEICLSGLSTYPTTVCGFIVHNTKFFIYHDRLELFRFMRNISEIHNPDWLFHNRTWRSIFIHHPNRLKLLRNFFHIALASYVVPDELMETYFNTDRDTVLSLMEDFSAIRESKRQSTKAILDFVKRLLMHCDMIVENLFFTIIFRSSFAQFAEVHALNYPANKTPNPSPGRSVSVTFGNRAQKEQP